MTITKVVRVKGILTKTKLPEAEYSANPYIGCTHACKYCYASYMTKFTQHSEEWGTFVDVKYWNENIITQKYNGKEILIGSVTDPYQPCEVQYRRTRALLEQLKKINAKITILTKSDLILRDIDLIKSFPRATICWSINTLDENFRKNMDSAVSIECRLHAMKVFHEKGIATACFIAPIFPKITDCKLIILSIKNICNFIWLDKLNLRGDNKLKILKWININYHELYQLYYDIYEKNNLLYWNQLDIELAQFCCKYKLSYVYNNWLREVSSKNSPVVVNIFSK